MTPASAVTAFPSPNHGERRGGARPSLIILHYTAMESSALAKARLCDAEAEVSAHWLIAETGEAEALVPEERRAWHAGRSHWRGIGDVNSHSIGIELANRGSHPFPEPQMAALELLLGQIMARWQILPEAVLAHSDIAPDRKSDPGPHFDWQRLARQGLAFGPVAVMGDAAPDSPPDLARFRACLLGYGYDPDMADDVLLRAFRLRFRPWGKGALAAEDLRLAQGLPRFPVDLTGAGA